MALAHGTNIPNVKTPIVAPFTAPLKLNVACDKLMKNYFQTP